MSEHVAKLATLRKGAREYDAAQQKRDRVSHPSWRNLVERKEEESRLRFQLGLVQYSDQEAIEAKLQDVNEEIQELSQKIEKRRTWEFEDAETQWHHDLLGNLVSRLQVFFDSDPRIGLVANVRQRLDFARRIDQETVSGPAAAQAWMEAIEDIEKLPNYGGLRLTAKMGLLPLRRDPRSGIWEFWHVQSGERPEAKEPGNPQSSWRIAEETGLVLILVPGGEFHMGAQRRDSTKANYDKLARSNEAPVKLVSLSPFFISKYEMTQGQWERTMGTNPSEILDLRRPVDSVSWYESREAVARLDLGLPTEAQWEYATRGGTGTPWWCGISEDSIVEKGAGNIQGDEDGYQAASPVGEFGPNGFGLHDVIGNLWEWCHDYGLYDEEPSVGTGERRLGWRHRSLRGGSYSHRGFMARSAFRQHTNRSDTANVVGLRPVMKVD